MIASLKAQFDLVEIDILPLRLTITQIPDHEDNLDPNNNTDNN